MPKSGDGKAGCGEGIFTLFPDGEEGKGTGEGEKLPGIGKACGQLFFQRGTVGEKISFFIGMEGENVPEKEIPGREACFQAGFPHYRIGGFIEPFFLLDRL